MRSVSVDRLLARLLLLASLGAAVGCSGVTTDKVDPIFYPPPPASPRLQFLTHYSTSKDVEAGRGGFDRFLLGEDQRVFSIMGPYGAAWDGDVLYVCDLVQGALLRLDLKVGKFDAVGRGRTGSLVKPINVFIDERGHKYVADIHKRRVIVYGPDDVHLRSFGEAGQFRPTDVAVRGDELFVCDLDGHQVEVLHRDTGELLRVVGPAIGEPGYLAKPTNISLDEAGNLYVVDTILCAASVFDPSGEFLRQIGSPGDVVGQFARPKGIAIDPDGFAYVVDSAFENCQIFTPDGEIALAFGGAGNLPGSMSLPTQVIISREGTEHFARYTAPGFDVRYLVFVINQFGPWKVNVYGFGRSAGHSYPD